MDNKIELIKKFLIVAIIIVLILAIALYFILSRKNIDQSTDLTGNVENNMGENTLPNENDNQVSRTETNKLSDVQKKILELNFKEQIDNTTKTEEKEQIVKTKLQTLYALPFKESAAEEIKNAFINFSYQPDLTIITNNSKQNQTQTIGTLTPTAVPIPNNIVVNNALGEIIVTDIDSVKTVINNEGKIKLMKQFNSLYIDQDPKLLMQERNEIFFSRNRKINEGSITDQIEKAITAFQNIDINREELLEDLQNPNQSSVDDLNRLQNLVQNSIQKQISNLPKNPTLDTLLSYISQKVGVPFGVFKAILIIEGPNYLNLSSYEIETYIKPNYVIPGCGPNICSAAGPMQMTIGYDNKGDYSCSQCCWNGECLNTKGGCPNAWLTYGDAVNKYEAEKRDPNVCNLLDNLYAAAEKIKTDSATKSKNTNWTKDEVFRAAVRYYGNCTATYARLNNKTYCEFVYDIYQSLGD
ncbi:MAG: hypothetical protein KatS3mg090_0159 [Patescibacteria group bacterium]|nr:MAG: hypothetical protein KatS3mg090_0159 [Patescibacteria group bacterium]